MEQSIVTDNDRLDFYSSLSGWGYMDVERAIEVYREAGLNVDELSSEILEFSYSCGVGLDKIDPVYVAYDSILQKVRNKIDDLIGFDFLNDGAEIDTISNFMCTSYDYSEENRNKLKEKLEGMNEEQKEEMRNDKVVMWFLGQIELEDSVKEGVN